jgi:hypothetical protein
MRRKLVVTAAAVLGFLFGAGIVASGKTQTVTRTTTVSHVAAVTQTRTVALVRKAHIPAACQKAIREARVASGVAGQGFAIASVFPPMVAEAAQAGVDQDVAHINAITARLKKDSAGLEALAPQLRTAAASFNKAASLCR